MKKAFLVTISIVALIAVTIIGMGVYVTNTPEYALKEMIDDVNASGMDGLYPHLTGEARATIDAVSSVTGNSIFNTIVGFISQSEYVSVLKSEIQEIQWEVDDVLKSKDNTSVILSFNYDDKLVGTIELSMVREDGEWKIDGLEFPKFDKINW